jgi:hypothetical protein
MPQHLYIWSTATLRIMYIMLNNKYTYTGAGSLRVSRIIDAAGTPPSSLSPVEPLNPTTWRLRCGQDRFLTSVQCHQV